MIRDVPNAQNLMRVVGASPRVMKVEAGARLNGDSRRSVRPECRFVSSDAGLAGRRVVSMH